MTHRLSERSLFVRCLALSLFLGGAAFAMLAHAVRVAGL